jgi:hypothetical protein
MDSYFIFFQVAELHKFEKGKESDGNLEYFLLQIISPQP